MVEQSKDAPTDLCTTIEVPALGPAQANKELNLSGLGELVLDLSGEDKALICPIDRKLQIVV